jgi:DNA-binding Xre family transcriptional regulator
MMAVSYKKLWHLLIDKNLKKTELSKMCGLSPATMARLSKGENITTDVLLRICKVLNCDISDIMEITPASKEGGVS